MTYFCLLVFRCNSKIKNRIISLHLKKYGYKKISKMLTISKNTITKIVQKYKKTINQHRRPVFTFRQWRGRRRTNFCIFNSAMLASPGFKWQLVHGRDF